MNIKQKAHKYLIDKGCLSMTQTYTAFEVEKMLVEFVEQNLREPKKIDMSLYTISCDPHNEFQKELEKAVWSEKTSEETETKNLYIVTDNFNTYILDQNLED